MWVTGSRTPSGFTLLELLVVLALIALLASALPVAFRQLMPGQQLKVASSELTTDLRALQAKAAMTGEKQGFRLEQAADIPKGIALQLVGVAGEGSDASAIDFFPDGSTSGGRIRLASGQRLVELNVSALTGRVRVIQP